MDNHFLSVSLEGNVHLLLGETLPNLARQHHSSAAEDTANVYIPSVPDQYCTCAKAVSEVRSPETCLFKISLERLTTLLRLDLYVKMNISIEN